MIIQHQNNVAAFAGNHVVYWVGQPLFQWRISAAVAVTDVLISQFRQKFRGVSSRVWGRVN